VVIYMHLPLYSPLLPVGQEDGWAQTWSGQYREEKNLGENQTPVPQSETFSVSIIRESCSDN
jgi:hypothetical protein